MFSGYIDQDIETECFNLKFKALFPLGIGCLLTIHLPPFPGLLVLKLWLGKKKKIFPPLTGTGELPGLSCSGHNCS